MILEDQNIDFLEAVFESIGEAMILVDDAFEIAYANKATEKIFGHPRNELLGQKLSILIPKEFHKRHKEHQKSYMENPVRRPMGRGMELYGKRKDGESFPIEVSLNHFRNGSRKYVVALVTDVTERHEIQQKLKHYAKNLEQMVDEKTSDLKEAITELEQEVREREEAERALAESQELYRIIARNFPKGTISVIDKDFKYVFIEGQELFRLGVTSESLLGTNFSSRLQPSIRESTLEALKPVFKGEPKRIEIKHKNSYYLLLSVPLKNKKGEVNRIMIVEQNITEQKKAEDDVKNALKKEIELGEMKSRFVSMASHEFRTPLSTILSSVFLAEKYADKGDSEKSSEHLKKIRQTVKILTEILNDFLSLGQLEEGKINLDPVPVSLKEFFDEIVEEMKGISRKGQRIESKLNLADPEVVVDQLILRNILQNLFSNSIKYSPEGSTIFFRVELKNGSLKMEVEDQGMGIPEEDKKHIFTRFFRAKNAGNIQGTGLGLNIVHKYAQLLGGDISFKSSEKKGTVFQIQVPVNR